MGLLDGNFNPEQFHAGSGLLGRLLSLPQMQGLHQSTMDVDPRFSVDNGLAAEVQLSAAVDASTSTVSASRALFGNHPAQA